MVTKRGERTLALAPIVLRLSFHDAFLHFGVCEVLDTVRSQRHLAPLWCQKGERTLALAPIVRKLSFHDAFLHYGVCEVLDTARSLRRLAPLW